MTRTALEVKAKIKDKGGNFKSIEALVKNEMDFYKTFHKNYKGWSITDLESKEVKFVMKDSEFFEKAQRVED